MRCSSKNCRLKQKAEWIKLQSAFSEVCNEITLVLFPKKRQTPLAFHNRRYHLRCI